MSYVCDPNRESTCVQDGSAGVFLYVFMLGQAIHGVGFTPMFTLGTAFVDDNAKTESTAVYLGKCIFDRFYFTILNRLSLDLNCCYTWSVSK